MQYPLIINSNGKAQKEDSWLNKKFSLSALGKITDEQSLAVRKFFMNKSEWDDILKYSEK